MKIAVLGGSFSPPHIGHLYIANEVLDNGMDKVIVIPCYNHVFKKLHDYDFRFKLCIETFKELGDRVEISDVEKRINKEKNYTIDTLKFILPELVDKYGDVELRLLVGSDIIEEKHKWEEWDEIIKIAQPLVATRKEYYPSSTLIRKKLETGEIEESLLVPSVVEILKKENPYRKCQK